MLTNCGNTSTTECARRFEGDSKQRINRTGNDRQVKKKIITASIW